ISGRTAYIAVKRDVGFGLFRLPDGQGHPVHIVLKDILYADIGTGIAIQCSFAGIVEPLGAVYPVQLDDAQGTFVTYLWIILCSKYLFDTCHHVFTVWAGFSAEELRVPIGIEL